MGILERRQRQKEEVRHSILTAAWQQVLAEGWSSLSIRKIADAIEYSVPVIYSHFDSKDAILMEFTREGFSRLLAAINAETDSLLSPAEQLERIGEAYWQFAFNNQAYYQLMFGLGIPTCEQAIQVTEMRQFGEVVMGLIGQVMAQDGAAIDCTNVHLKFQTYWSLLHGLVSIRMIDRHPGDEAMGLLVLQDAVGSFVKALTR